jgi:type IV secretion system protein VirB10
MSAADLGGLPGRASADAATAASHAEVRGERTTALVGIARSLQSRASSLLAATVMIALGIAALTWYYGHAFARPARALQGAQATAVTRAQAEMALPALGPIVPPLARVPTPAAAGRQPAAIPDPAQELPLTPVSPGPGETPAQSGAALAKSAGELAFERRLSGSVFTRELAAAGSGLSGAAAATPLPAAPASAVSERGASALGGLLVPTLAPATQAQRAPDNRFLLPKGAFLDCTLETAIDSTLPGMTTCVTAMDTFSADGKVVLLERGTKLVGETRGQVQQGQARLFVLWTQARTPTGVVVPLDSPGTDELGRAGVSGEVERHFWQRFGAAILISVVNGAVQAGVQAASSSSGTVIYAPAGSQDILTEVLKDTVQIPPTILKANGDRIQVLVARDVDFRPVYELRAVAGG